VCRQTWCSSRRRPGPSAVSRAPEAVAKRAHSAPAPAYSLHKGPTAFNHTHVGIGDTNPSNIQRRVVCLFRASSRTRLYPARPLLRNRSHRESLLLKSGSCHPGERPGRVKGDTGRVGTPFRRAPSRLAVGDHAVPRFVVILRRIGRRVPGHSPRAARGHSPTVNATTKAGHFREGPLPR